MLALPAKQKRWLARYAGGFVAVVVLVLSLAVVLQPTTARTWMRDIAARAGAGTSGPLLLATGARSGGFYLLGMELAATLRAKGPGTLEVIETAGTVDNLDRLRRGEVSLALVQGGGLGALLYPGDGTAAEPPIVGISTLARQYVHLIVPADSDIRTLRDLAGKRVGVGQAGSGFEPLARQVFEFQAYSLPPLLVQGHDSELSAAFQAGSIDAAFTVYSLFAPVVERLLATGYYRLVPLAEAAAIARHVPGVYPEDLPPGLYGPERSIPYAIDGPFPTLRVDTLLVARQDTSGSQIKSVLEALYCPEFRHAARLNALDESSGREVSLLPLHAAAEDWYARNEPLTSDRFEIASFFLAGLLALASAAQYLVRRRANARQTASRRAIRGYFERMLEYGSAVEETSEPGALTAIMHDMMGVQREAEREWLAGHLETEHMENLYLVYNARSRSAFDKILQIHLQAIAEGRSVPTHFHPTYPQPSFGPPPAAPRPEPAPAAISAPLPRAVRPEPATTVAASSEFASEDAVISTPKPRPARPEETAARGASPAPSVAPAAPPTPAAAPKVAAPASTPAVPTSVPAPPSSISAPRPMKKDKKSAQQAKRERREAAAAAARTAAPSAAPPATPAASPAARPAPPTPQSEAAETSPWAETGYSLNTNARRLTEWEIERKYQRSDEYVPDGDSGIVSAPRPRRRAPEAEAVPVMDTADHQDFTPDEPLADEPSSPEAAQEVADAPDTSQLKLF